MEGEMKNIIRSLLFVSALTIELIPGNANAYYRNNCSDYYFRMDHPRYCGVYIKKGPNIIEGVGRGVGGILEGLGEGIGAILSIPFGGPTYYYDRDYYYDRYGRRHYHW